MYLGIDLGSSSIKLSLFDAESGTVIHSLSYPKEELAINAPEFGWAEQNPEDWWENFQKGYAILIKESGTNPKDIQAIGISYQMHGLVLVDEKLKVLRPSIIWCDSRAVEAGNEAFDSLGRAFCLPHLLNSPGNFTASKLAWVKQNEPEIYSKIHKFMLPGDFIAMKLSGRITTTNTGLSEGIFWDFKQRGLSQELLSVYGISEDLVPEVVPAIGDQVSVKPEVAAQLGLLAGVSITYRGGDQPNNAFSLNVLNPGETASTAGTSGVIYAVTDKNAYDEKSRINTFLHVNDTPEAPRNGVLICINGTGILYNWLRRILNTGSGNIDYIHMNDMVDSVKAGSEGLACLPFGNGAERIFENRIVGSHLLNMDFNRHHTSHILRASVEGIVYALNLGFEMLENLGIEQNRIRAGHANLFLSKSFREIFVNVTGIPLELYNTDGAAGAARGAALGSGFYTTPEEAFSTLERIAVIDPNPELAENYKQLFGSWKQEIEKHSF
ncbi:MAG: carbohydrate kinase [Balneola sp.]|nr:MAG: carbohydrate kinase [Balneola sp.]